MIRLQFIAILEPLLRNYHEAVLESPVPGMPLSEFVQTAEFQEQYMTKSDLVEFFQREVPGAQTGDDQASATPLVLTHSYVGVAYPARLPT